MQLWDEGASLTKSVDKKNNKLTVCPDFFQTGVSRWEQDRGGATPARCRHGQKEAAHHRGSSGGEIQRQLGTNLRPGMDDQKHTCGLRHARIPSWEESQQELLQVSEQLDLSQHNLTELQLDNKAHLFIYLFIQFKVTGTMHINKHFCKCAGLAILADFQPQSLGRCDGNYKT